ncbi:Preflagellin peptidase [uncultured archaeon]|nr:Preflagellin peptidase [uncultured archaeon]
MIEVIFLWVLALIFIVFAVFQDLKTREIANWISFSLIIFALGFRFFYSLFNNADFSFFYQGLIGLGIFFALGNLFYYGKVFAGGDAKLMIALGTVLPFYSDFFSNLQLFFNFLLIFLFAGFAYILVSSTILCAKNFKAFKKEFSMLMKKNKKISLIIFSISFLSLLASFVKIVFIFFGIFLAFTYLLYLYSKAIDESCMVREIHSVHLREGDWLYSDLKIGRDKIKASWDGLSLEEIKKIKKKLRKVKIRQGIPFSPNFLISFIIFIILAILKTNLWDPFWKP